MEKEAQKFLELINGALEAGLDKLPATAEMVLAAYGSYLWWKFFTVLSFAVIVVWLRLVKEFL